MIREIDHARAKHVYLKSLHIFILMKSNFFFFFFLCITFFEVWEEQFRTLCFIYQAKNSYPFFTLRTAYFTSTVISKKFVTIWKTRKKRSQQIYQNDFKHGKRHQNVFTAIKILLVIRPPQLITGLFLNVMMLEK